ncbi:hypothetical protein DENSPDRAFT_668827 [Dentipellis sp. KUC8613]|nr:hypothetical protein DENSPDRAFT_668827 [Dentipellis sp. KUC8613]
MDNDYDADDDGQTFRAQVILQMMYTIVQNQQRQEDAMKTREGAEMILDGDAAITEDKRNTEKSAEPMEVDAPEPIPKTESDEAKDKLPPKQHNTCDAAAQLEQDFKSNPTAVDIPAWTAAHRKAFLAEPTAHTGCHRLIWRAIDVLEPEPGSTPDSSSDPAPVDPHTQAALTELMREVFYCLQPHSFIYRQAGMRLISLLCSSTPPFDVLEEAAYIRRGLLKTRHDLREADDIGDMLQTLAALCRRQALRYLDYALEERAAFARQALVLTPGDPTLVSALVDFLGVLYDRSSQPAHLQEMVWLREEINQRKEGVDCAVLSGMETHLEEKTRLSSNVSTWLRLHRRMCELAPRSHAGCPERLVALAEAMEKRKLGEDLCMVVLKEADRLTSAGTGASSRLKVLNALVGLCKYSRNEKFQKQVDEYKRPAFTLLRGTWHTISALRHLSRKRAPNPLDDKNDGLRAASIVFDATAAPIRGDLPQLLWVNPFRAHYQMLHRPADTMADYADAYRREARALGDIDRLPPGSPARAHACVVHAHALIATNHTELLGPAIGLCWEAIQALGYAPGMPAPIPDPLRAALSAFGHALYLRYTHFGALEDLDQAVNAQKICVAGVLGPQRFAMYNSLSMALVARYRRLGEITDILLAMELSRQLLVESGIKEPSIVLIASWGYGRALVAFFEANGGSDVLDQAAGVVRSAVRACGLDHPLLAVTLALQGTILRYRFILHGNEEDLRAGWTLAGAAVATHESTGIEDQNLMDSVAAKGWFALVKWEDGGNVEDLNEAIDLFRRVAEDRDPRHPDRAEALFRLGDSLRKRSQLQANPNDLVEAVCLCRDALEVQPDTRHPRYPFWAAALASCLMLMARTEGSANSLEEAVVWAELALSLTPETHPALGEVVACFGDVLYARYEAREDANDLNECLRMYAQAATSTTSPSRYCLRYTKTWETIATKHGRASSIAAVYDVRLQQQLRSVNIGQTIQARHSTLTKSPIESSRAAAYAIAEGKLERAVELLEHGRSILWQQTLRLRPSMDRLREVSPDLANRLSKTIHELEGVMHTQSVTYAHATVESIRDPDRTGRRHRDLAETYERLLAQVRKLDGFGDFMHLTTFADLDGIASEGPIIIVNLCEDRCDALILTATHGIRHVRLLEASFTQFETVQAGLAEAAEALECDPTMEAMEEMDAKLLSTLRLLWQTIVSPVMRELNDLGPIPRRLFWCMAGAADLPIHAAGPYVQGRPNLPDITVSSYTPTLTALLRARRSKGAQSPKMLAIAQTETPGFGDLPCAKTEIQCLKKYCTLPLTELVDNATPHDVQYHLQDHSWVHFCCHGTVDAQQPLLSAFHLNSEAPHIGTLNIEAIMRAKLPYADFAYLSACHTASGSVARSESMSLAAALQVTGFRSIIATMYSIGDDDGPVVAKEVYKYLFRDSSRAPDSADAAVAIHRAATVLRKAGVQLFRWVPFIHIGL